MTSEGLIAGKVNADREAVVAVPIRDSRGTWHTLDVVIDTGYSGSLALPQHLILKLDLPRVWRDSGILADGRATEFDVHRGEVSWFGLPRKTYIDAMDCPPMIGMELLTNHLLTILVADGGEVTIKRFA